MTGSIASRNTIAGAGQEKVPEGIGCLPGDTRLNCAQRYDLDYLRRFTAVIDDIAGKSYIINSGKFSGGGKCPGGNCSYDGLLPTIVTLIVDQIDETNSELAPFFIEQDPRTFNNPPPGFTVLVGLESIQEIR